MGKREANKQEKRDRILAAARSIIQDDSFSLRALAERANVSVVTVYSLFGSRHGVITALYMNSLNAFEHEQSSLHANAVDRMFFVPEFTTRHLNANPDYNRALFRAISDGRAPALASGFLLPRIKAWEVMIGDAIDEGLLTPPIDARALAKNILHMLVGSILDWMRGDNSIDEMHAESCYGLSLILAPLATDKVAASLKARIDLHYRELRQLAEKAGS